MQASKVFLITGGVLLSLFMLVVFLSTSASSPANQEVEPEEQVPLSQIDTSTSDETEQKLKSIRQFTADEFKQAFNTMSHPNITPIVVAPEITGNSAVDDYIRSRAEARGYSLRRVASGLLNEVDGIRVQELLIQDWRELKKEAQDNGINLQIVSGYRSIEDQRALFVDRFRQLGLTDEAVLSGIADSQLDALLAVTAPPGYSRHHSGYTIDFEDPAFAYFAGSTADTWLQADNYAAAKKHGFIPSYPDGATRQGPDPEPWEYVWVGTNVTHQ